MSLGRLSLFVALGVCALAFSVFWVVGERRRSHPRVRPNAVEVAIGVVTDFFDTLGIGSFATTTALFRPRQTVADEHIPGTLNVGHTLPTFAQAFIYIAVVDVEITTLVTMIGAAVLGAYAGAGTVSKWPRSRIQLGMGLLLIVAAAIIVVRQLGLGPAGGTARGLTGGVLATAAVGNFILGALMTLGIGLYAPCMILVTALGMEPEVAFPIMMGSCAFLMPVASIRFVRASKYSLPAAIGLTVGGVPAVLVAAYVVRSLPLDVLKWLVAAVVLYTAITLLIAGRKGRLAGTPEGAAGR